MDKQLQIYLTNLKNNIAACILCNEISTHVVNCKECNRKIRTCNDCYRRKLDIVFGCGSCIYCHQERNDLLRKFLHLPPADKEDIYHSQGIKEKLNE